MTTLRWLAAASLAFVLVPALSAEAHCPGNVASIRPRFIGRSLVAVPVLVDNAGPYEFVVDTGAQFTTIDRQLASELHPKLLGETHVRGVLAYSPADFAQLQLIQVGTHSIKDPVVLVQDFPQWRQLAPAIHGILGENFLEHYDLLVDYEHRVVCLDDTKEMQQKVEGEHIVLTQMPHADHYLPFTLPLIVSTRVSGIKGALLLQLDSGIDVPLLFEYGKRFTHSRFFVSPVRQKSDDEKIQTVLLQPQDIQVGDFAARKVSVVAPVAVVKVPGPTSKVDGSLPTALFRSVFISSPDHFAILQP